MRKGLLIAALLVTANAAMAISQEASIGTLDRDKVTAGQKFHLKVILAVAPTYAGNADSRFDYKPTPGLPVPDNPLQLYCDGNTSTGSRDLGNL
jgi:hypothetical protein